MRIPRVFVEAELHPGAGLKLPEAQAHYVGRVLRLRAGSPLVVFNGDGSDYAAGITSSDRAGVEVRIDARLPAVRPSPLHITLAQGLSRGERMDYTLQKAVELGVAAIRPVVTARSEVRLDGSRLEKRMTHWHSVIVSACEQCGRADLPALARPRALEEWLSQPAAGARLVLDPAAPGALAALEPVAAVELLIGPEGGWEPAEMKRLAGSGVQSVRLGPRVLRTETAGPAAIAVLQAMFGDLGPTGVSPPG